MQMELQRLNNMEKALSAAKEAFSQDEVPVGCVITNKNNEVIGTGRNRCEEKHDATAHAEIEAIREASKTIGSWHLDDCTLYVTLEPCPMCTGAIINSRIKTIVYGAKDKEKGALGSVIDLLSEDFHHKAAVYSDVLGDESRQLLKEFFKGKR